MEGTANSKTSPQPLASTRQREASADVNELCSQAKRSGLKPRQEQLHVSVQMFTETEIECYTKSDVCTRFIWKFVCICTSEHASMERGSRVWA